MNRIIVLKEPDVSPTRIQIANYDDQPGGIRFAEYFGANSPLAQINNVILYDKLVISFRLDLTGFVPTIDLVVNNMDGTFAQSNYPTDGDVITIYVKSKNPNHKSVSMDFRITSVSAPPSVDDRSYTTDFSVSGVLDIKELAKSLSYSHDGTSFNTLMDLSGRFGLGFASNITDTNDNMIRICPFDKAAAFMQDIILSMYLDDASFFTGYIDHYYYMNVVQVNDMIVTDFDPDSVTYLNDVASRYRPDDNITEFDAKFILSNSKAVYNTPFHISGFSIVNNTGSISLGSGYARNLVYYDKDPKLMQEVTVYPLVTNDVDQSTVVLRGRDNEDINSQMIQVNRNYQFASNVHNDWYHSMEINYLNNQELNKLGLVVRLRGANLFVHRYMIIPVYIVKKELGGESTSEELDVFASGNYVITGIVYGYDNDGSYYTTLYMSKREWTMP